MQKETAASPEGASPIRPRHLVAAAGMVSIATMVSRVLGVAREMVMARYFGAGFFTDAFNAAYRVPNLLRDLFAEGALSAAFVPTFTRTLSRSGAQAAWLLASKVINALAVVLGIMTLVFYFGARLFVYLLAAGFAETPGKIELTVQLTRIMSPFLLWVSLAAVVMGMLNSCGSFFLPALAPSAFNVCSILAGIFLSPLMPRWGLAPVVSMAIGALVGGASQFFVQLPAAHRRGFRYRLVFDFSDPDLRHIAQLMLPAVVGLSATQINITVDNQLASHFGDGPVSWLNYSFRLMQLPIGLFGVAIATATTALVSQHAAQNAFAKLRGTVGSSLRLAACFTFPATVGLIVFREEIVRLLYERGEFLSSDTVRTSQALVFYALALFAYSGVKILVPTFYALNDTKVPVRTSMISVGVKILVNFVLIVPMGFLGLPLATAVASWLNLALLFSNLDKRIEGKWTRRELLPYLKIAFASVVMGGLSWAALRLTLILLPGNGFVPSALRLGVAIAIGIAVLLPVLHAMGVEETRQVAGIAARRLGLGRGER
jgi:putative peptidoglycan lipid II flippase